ncbi:Calcium-transporting ATPase 1 [compost metagenome]
MQRLTARNAFVRNLPSVETLGSVSVICTDKTGTLTTGSMRVREVWGDDPFEIVRAAASCVDAEITKDGTESGDPTEVAILYAAFERGIEKIDIETKNPRISSEPFDAGRRRMSIFRQDRVNYVKGAVENIVAICKLDDVKQRNVLKATDEMSSRGLRVLAIATGKQADEKDLQFLGLLGIADPPRTEVIAAIKEARTAGITTVMITGDHPQTAAAIAREIGLVHDGESIESRVHARATPEEKLKLVREWKAQGAVVAMTGDGVNDAPALKEAHVGVAMGRGGSEVTRQAADLVLADDNYATIIAAVREGRHIFKNIRRAIVYLLTGNFAEVMVVLAAMIMGVPIPLLAAHLLWINLVTDSLPALTLMAEPLSPDTMKVGPRLVAEKILGAAEWRRILGVGLIEASVVFIFYYFSLQGQRVETAQGYAFTTLVFSQLFRSFAARSKDRVFWQVGLFSNLWLLGVVVLTIFLQVSLHFIPVTQRIFKLEPLSFRELLFMLGISFITVTIIELKKVGLALFEKKWTK